MDKQQGFTLAEVLASLVLLGLALSLAASTLNWQVKVAKLGEERVETQQALRVAAMYLEREIRSAKSISLVTADKLKIIRNSGQNLVFYVADKDGNGIQDLYQELDGIATPLVSCVTEAKFCILSPDLWEVSLLAKQGSEEQRWLLVIKKRAS